MRFDWGGLFARMWGVVFGTACVVLAAACSPDAIAAPTAVITCSTPRAAIVAGGSSEASVKAATYKRLTDQSTVVGDDKAGELAQRQSAFLLGVRRAGAQETSNFTDLAEIRDSIEKIPGVLEHVKHIEAMMLLGRARWQARHKLKGAHLVQALADTIDYYGFVDNVWSVAADTSYSGGDVGTALSAHFSDLTSDGLNYSDQGAQFVGEYLWRYAGFTGPVWSISPQGCMTPSTGNLALPGWIKSTASWIAGNVASSVASAVRTGTKISDAVAGGFVDGLVGAGIIAGLEYGVDQTKAVITQEENAMSMCLRSALSGYPCSAMLRADRRRLQR
jgi:hypothetical protein